MEYIGNNPKENFMSRETKAETGSMNRKALSKQAAGETRQTRRTAGGTTAVITTNTQTRELLLEAVKCAPASTQPPILHQKLTYHGKEPTDKHDQALYALLLTSHGGDHSKAFQLSNSSRPQTLAVVKVLQALFDDEHP